MKTAKAICPRVADFPAGVPLPKGVEPGACGRCSQPVHTSPSTRAAVAAGLAEVVCDRCFEADGPGPGPVSVVVTPQAAAELEEYRRANAPDFDPELLKRFLDQLEGRAKREYQSGRLGPDDEGSLVVAVTSDAPSGTVVMSFGKRTTWLALEAEHVGPLAAILVNRARDVARVPFTIDLGPADPGPLPGGLAVRGDAASGKVVVALPEAVDGLALGPPAVAALVGAMVRAARAVAKSPLTIDLGGALAVDHRGPTGPAGPGEAIACVRIEDVVPRARLLKGTKPGACLNCSQPVYTSPATRRLVREEGAVVVCTRCVPAGETVRWRGEHLAEIAEHYADPRRN